MSDVLLRIGQHRLREILETYHFRLSLPPLKNYGEIAAALGIKKDEVQGAICSHVNFCLSELLEKNQDPAQASIIPDTILNTPVADMELSVRSRKCLQKLEISTVGMLISKTDADLLAVHGFGYSSLVEIAQALDKQFKLALRKS